MLEMIAQFTACLCGADSDLSVMLNGITGAVELRRCGWVPGVRGDNRRPCDPACPLCGVSPMSLPETGLPVRRLVCGVCGK